MSIFGRKEIAELKKELDTINKQYELLKSENSQLNEKCSRYQSALNATSRENEDYKRKYTDLLADVSSNNKCDVSDSANFELKRLEQKCDDYKHWLENANREIEEYRQRLHESQMRENNLEKRYMELADRMSKAGKVNSTNSQSGKNSTHNISDDYVIDGLLEGYSDALNDVDTTDLQNRKDPIYNITDQVRESPDYMATLYCSKNSFLSPNEFKMYTLLENFAYKYCADFGSLSIFANTRLADFIKLFESSYVGEKDSFSKKAENKPKKKAICEIIDKFMPNFNNEDYKLAFLYPLLRMHVDFLICADSEEDDDTTKPILAIEMYGSEHNENSEKPNRKTIFNDNFKKSLFSFKNNAMGVRLLIIKNEELEDEDKLENKIYDAVERCLQNPPEPVGNKKWNNTVYGNNGQHFIYVDGRKSNITDKEAEILNYYIKDMSDFFYMSNIFQN